MGKLIDLTGKTFGNWTVLWFSRTTYQPLWLCICKCGTQREVSGSNLRGGISTNCGCERTPRTIHGHGRRKGRTLTYRAWKGMHTRCKPERSYAKNYYERGIVVCDRWSSYEAFLEDMGECPPGMTLDRIDNDRGYEPGNCRWADRGVQRRNCRRVTFIETDGNKLPLKDAVAPLGVSDAAVHQEHKRNGGTVQEAFDRVKQRRTKQPI